MGQPLDIKNNIIKGVGRFAESAIGGLGGAALNYGISKYNRGASKADQKEMAKYNYDLEMQKWNDTNYGAQMKHMKDAGLSESLMYGGSGTGGSTASAITSGGGSQESGRIQGMDIGQSAMMASTIALQNSQARKNEVEANKIEGADTKGTELDNELKQWSIKLRGATFEDSVNIAKDAVTKLRAEIHVLGWQQTEYGAKIDNLIKDTILKDKQANLTDVQAEQLVEKTNTIWAEIFRKEERDEQDYKVAEEQMKTYLIGQGINAGGRLLSDLIKIYMPGGLIGKGLEGIGKIK